MENRQHFHLFNTDIGQMHIDLFRIQVIVHAGEARCQVYLAGDSERYINIHGKSGFDMLELINHANANPTFVPASKT